MGGVPFDGIKEYAGHVYITETQKYLKFTPQLIELTAGVANRLAALAQFKSSRNNQDAQPEAAQEGH